MSGGRCLAATCAAWLRSPESSAQASAKGQPAASSGACRHACRRRPQATGPACGVCAAAPCCWAARPRPPHTPVHCRCCARRRAAAPSPARRPVPAKYCPLAAAHAGMRLAAWGCSFPERRLERAWQQKFCSDQAALDSAISLQTLLFPSMVARVVRPLCRVVPAATPRRRCRRRCRPRVPSNRGAPASRAALLRTPLQLPRACPSHPAVQLWERVHCGGVASLAAWEVLWLAVFLAWAPLFLFLAQRRPQAWQRWRTPLVLASRVHRQLTGAPGVRRRPPCPAACSSTAALVRQWQQGCQVCQLTAPLPCCVCSAALGRDFGSRHSARRRRQASLAVLTGEPAGHAVVAGAQRGPGGPGGCTMQQLSSPACPHAGRGSRQRQLTPPRLPPPT